MQDYSDKSNASLNCQSMKIPAQTCARQVCDGGSPLLKSIPCARQECDRGTVNLPNFLARASGPLTPHPLLAKIVAIYFYYLGEDEGGWNM